MHVSLPNIITQFWEKDEPVHKAHPNFGSKIWLQGPI